MPANRVPLRYGSEHPDPDERPQAGSPGSVGEVYHRAASTRGKSLPPDSLRDSGATAQELLEWSDWVAVLGAVDRHGADTCRKWITEYLAENPNGKLVK